jgi:hypothetical protein
MTNELTSHLDNVINIRTRTLTLLEDMDEFIDKTTNPEEWSIRDIIYHLSDTPVGGLGLLFQGMVSGDISEFDLIPDLTNVTHSRKVTTLDEARHELLRTLDGIEHVVSLGSSALFEGTTVTAHLKSRNTDETRTLETLLRGLFARHWLSHLDQLESLTTNIK